METTDKRSAPGSPPPFFSYEEQISQLKMQLAETRAQLEHESRERERVTRFLNEKNFHLTTLLEQMPAMLWTVDRDLVITTSLGSGLEKIHVKPNELVGKRLHDYRQTESEMDPSIVEHREAIRGKSFTYEDKVFDRNLAINLQPLRETNGEIVGAIGVALDITKLKETERRLEGHSRILELISSENRQEEVFRAVIDFIEKFSDDVQASIHLLDPTGKILLHGAAPSLPDEFNSLVHGREIGPTVGSCGTSAFLGQPIIVENTLTHPLWANYRDIAEKFGLKSCWSQPSLSSERKVLGTFAIYTKRTPRGPSPQQRADMGTLAHLLSLSIERKRNQESLATSIHLLRASNADLERFASVLSHDLREPLRTAITYLKVAMETYRNPEDLHFGAEQSLAVLVRMRRLIDGLLELSRIEPRPLPFEAVDFNQLLDVVFADLQALLGESGTKLTRDPMPIVHGDPVQLAQLMQNLIRNAIKYRTDSAPEIHVSTKEMDKEWIFSVRDNGRGFDMKAAKRIFLPFCRLVVSQSDESLGIGLSVCEKIVQRHGGRIWAESAPGRGSLFHFTLPRHVP